MSGEQSKIEFHTENETNVDNFRTQLQSFNGDERSQEQSLLEQVLETAETGVWYWNLTAGKVQWPGDVFPLSETATEPFDYEEFLSLVHPNDRTFVDQNWTALREGHSHEIKYRLTVDDETRWVKQTADVETADDGTPQRAVGLLCDITEENERQRDLRNFQEIVEHTGHSVYWTDEDGTIQYVNPAFEEITGYSYEEAVGKTPRILKSGVHDEEFYEEMWETIGNGNVWSHEIVNERQTGEQYVVNQTIAPIETENGEIDRYVAVNSDITEQKEYEHELEILRAAIDKAHVPIMLSDPTEDQNPIVYVNEAFEELTGYTEAEARGRNCRMLHGEETEIDRRYALKEAIDDEEPFSIELRSYRKDETMFWNNVTVTPIYDDEGNLVRFLVTMDDVTRRREHEQRLKVLNRMLRHNLRNKLSIIVGYTSALKDTLDESPASLSGGGELEDVHTQIDSILDTATELGRIGDKVRRFQNVVDQTNRTDPVQVKSTLELLQSRFLSEFPDANIEIEGEDDLAIRINRRAFELAVSELLENALVHSQSSTPLAKVTVEQSGTNTVSIRITDSGPGIPDIERKILTEGEESPLLHGSGFGLWIVNWLILRSGGSVSISENDPTGTVVELRLPAAGKR